MLLNLKIPKAYHKIQVDTKKPGLIILEGNNYSIDGEIVEFITDMLQELKDLRDIVDIYEKEYIITQGEA